MQVEEREDAFAFFLPDGEVRMADAGQRDELAGRAGLLQRGVEKPALLDGDDRVGVAVKDEQGRRVFGKVSQRAGFARGDCSSGIDYILVSR